MAEEMRRNLYFAYGSNMDSAQMQHRCSRPLFVGCAELHGYEFGLDVVGVATVNRKAGATVHGALWLITPDDEATLDGYEGVAVGWYRKEHLEVTDSSGNRVRALVYISNNRRIDGCTSRPGYLAGILESARTLEFDEAYLNLLRSWA